MEVKEPYRCICGNIDWEIFNDRIKCIKCGTEYWIVKEEVMLRRIDVTEFNDNQILYKKI